MTAPCKDVLRNNFPVSFFLDPKLHQACAPRSATPCHLPVPSDVKRALGSLEDQKAMAEEYFNTAHRWMPIIFRPRFYGSLSDPTLLSECSFIFILLSMKLILSVPDEMDQRSDLYVLIKEWQLRIEMAGILNVYVLQSIILTALYEMGHAIFPGAFTTISTAARCAIALGITETTPVKGQAWIEQEERNRTWWAVIILDR